LTIADGFNLPKKGGLAVAINDLWKAFRSAPSEAGQAPAESGGAANVIPPDSVSRCSGRPRIDSSSITMKVSVKFRW
jgi:hypothetical protein